MQKASIQPEQPQGPPGQAGALACAMARQCIVRLIWVNVLATAMMILFCFVPAAITGCSLSVGLRLPWWVGSIAALLLLVPGGGFAVWIGGILERRIVARCARQFDAQFGANAFERDEALAALRGCCGEAGMGKRIRAACAASAGRRTRMPSAPVAFPLERHVSQSDDGDVRERVAAFLNGMQIASRRSTGAVDSIRIWALTMIPAVAGGLGWWLGGMSVGSAILPAMACFLTVHLIAAATEEARHRALMSRAREDFCSSFLTAADGGEQAVQWLSLLETPQGLASELLWSLFPLRQAWAESPVMVMSARTQILVDSLEAALRRSSPTRRSVAAMCLLLGPLAAILAMHTWTVWRLEAQISISFGVLMSAPLLAVTLNRIRKRRIVRRLAVALCDMFPAGTPAAGQALRLLHQMFREDESEAAYKLLMTASWMYKRLARGLMHGEGNAAMPKVAAADRGRWPRG
jgi:hypothetical protein